MTSFRQFRDPFSLSGASKIAAENQIERALRNRLAEILGRAHWSN